MSLLTLSPGETNIQRIVTIVRQTVQFLNNLGWTAWTPTITAQTPGVTPPTFTKNAASYLQIGKLVHYQFDLTVTAAGTGTGQINVTLPVAALASSAFATGGLDFNTGKVVGFGFSGSISNTTGVIVYFDGSTPIVTNSRLVIGGSYRTA